jgi:hypothetical protein
MKSILQNTIKCTSQTTFVDKDHKKPIVQHNTGFIIIAKLLLISDIEINSGHCLTSDESGIQSDISIESESTLLQDLSILMNASFYFNNDMKINVMIKLVTHKQEEEMLYT